jgi:polar amino acid transport system substrate-binding protein
MKRPGVFLVYVLAIAAMNHISAGGAWAGEVLDRITRKGVLVAAIDPAWPPMSWRNEAGRYEGFDVEVANEIARRMKVQLQFATPKFEDITAGHWNGAWDVATSLTPTEQRAANLDFPVVYWYGLSALAVHRDNTTIRVPSDASGRRIGVLKSSEYEKYLTREPFDVTGMSPINYKIDNPQIALFDTTNGPFDALSKGDGVEIDAMIDSVSTLLSEIAKGRPLKIVGQPLMYTPSALATEPGDPEFAAILKKTVDDMQRDGTLSAISMKWFNFDVTKGG